MPPGPCFEIRRGGPRCQRGVQVAQRLIGASGEQKPHLIRSGHAFKHSRRAFPNFSVDTSLGRCVGDHGLSLTSWRRQCDLATKFYPVLSSLPRFWVAASWPVAAGGGAGLPSTSCRAQGFDARLERIRCAILLLYDRSKLDDQALTSMTTRPRIFPARMSSASVGSAEIGSVRVIVAKCCVSSDCASVCQAR